MGLGGRVVRSGLGGPQSPAAARWSISRLFAIRSASLSAGVIRCQGLLMSPSSVAGGTGWAAYPARCIIALRDVISGSNRFLPLLLLLFAASGCAALIYEVV